MSKSFDTGAWTSAYAEMLANRFKAKVRKELLQFLELVKDEGATDQELETQLGRPGNTLRPARVSLCHEGFVEDSGKWRFTVSRRPAIVWVLSCHASQNKTNKTMTLTV